LTEQYNKYDADDDNESNDGKGDINERADEESGTDSEDAASGSLFHIEHVGSDDNEDEVPGTPGQTQLRMSLLRGPHDSPLFLAPAAPTQQFFPRRLITLE
jgi:hypothetical protein